MAYNAWSVIAGEVPTATKWNVLGANDDNFNARLGQLEADKTLLTDSDDLTVTFDLLDSKIHTVVLGGNRTLALSNVEIGKAFAIRLVQGSGGNKKVVWWNGIKWPGGAEPILSLNEGEIDCFMFIPNSAGEFDGYFVGFGLSQPE